MLKYLCLVALVAKIYSAAVDDTVGVQTTSSDGDSLLPDDDQRKQPKIVEILESGSDHQSDGSYSFHYRGADGTFREETAVVKNPGTEEQHLEVSGAYSFVDGDGKEVRVHYTADDRGFVPVGSNIPDIISLTAKANSQLPAVKKSVIVDDSDTEDRQNMTIPSIK